MKNIKFPSTKTNILPGPLRIYAPFSSIYEPVDCDFTDELEYVSIKKIKVEVQHWGAQAEVFVNSGFIVDILTYQKEEFVVMSGGEKIRLDRISEIRIV